jgi:hypothetical protein
MITLMDRIDSPVELTAWLKDKPVEWAQVIALRAALRALPYIGLASQPWLRSFALLPFGALIASWMQLETDGRTVFTRTDASRANARFSGQAFDYDLYKSERIAHLAADASYHSADAQSGSMHVISDCVKGVSISAQAIRMFSDLTVEDGHGEQTVREFWARIAADCQWLMAHPRDIAAASLAAHQLWPESPRIWSYLNRRLSADLLEIDPAYQIWIDWLARRIRGEHAAFDIPGDKGREEDIAILRRLTTATNEGFWDRGAAYVNRQLSGWLTEARARSATKIANLGKRLGIPAVAQQLQAAASPQASVSDGKLDAGPNTQFDQPTYSGDLADLPSAMRSFIKVLLKSLGENASAFMRSSLEGYHEELELRGTQPIVGTLKGLAQAISREIWTSQSLVASDDPDDWEMRDEREWGAGMGDLFRTFAKYSADLINHFPLDEEREELLRATPIDEMAASGDALTEPIALVTGLVRDLHAQGMATDNILRIIDAHAQYNRDIASLPPPPANLPDDYVTAKRRHVLMTAGFYLHLYSVLGSTASLAPAYSAMGTFVWNAAQALLAFVR